MQGSNFPLRQVQKMLIALVIVVYTLIILYLYGKGCDLLIGAVLQTRLPGSPTRTVLLGLAAITTLASAASLFIRIGLEFQLILLAGALPLAVLLLRKKELLPALQIPRFNLAQKLGLVVLAAGLGLLIYAGSLTPENADTGIYHAQAIHWIETYPAVPGLVNLHKRLGYNSSWLVTTATFSFSFLKGQSFHQSTLALFLVMAGYFWGGIHNLLGGKRALSDLLKLGFFASIFVFQFTQISSPGTDSPAYLLGWYLLTEAVATIENGGERLRQNGIALIVLTAYCLTVKLSAAPLVILAIWAAAQGGIFRSKRLFGWTSALVLAVLAPFLARSVVLTGYPVFPGFGINLFGVDWAYPADKAVEEVQSIHWFALHSEVDYDVYVKLSFVEQFKLWFVYQLPRFRAIIVFVLAMLPVYALLAIWQKWRFFWRQRTGIWIVYLTAAVHCGYWLLSAPSFRFGTGVSLAVVMLLGMPLVVFLLENMPALMRIVPAAALVVCAAVCLQTARDYVQPEEAASILVMPADYPDWKTEPCEYRNFNLFCPGLYGECWYSTFPCGFKSDPHVEMRGGDYSDGFRYVE